MFGKSIKIFSNYVKEKGIMDTDNIKFVNNDRFAAYLGIELIKVDCGYAV